MKQIKQIQILKNFHEIGWKIDFFQISFYVEIEIWCRNPKFRNRDFVASLFMVFQSVSKSGIRRKLCPKLLILVFYFLNMNSAFLNVCRRFLKKNFWLKIIRVPNFIIPLWRYAIFHPPSLFQDLENFRQNSRSRKKSAVAKFSNSFCNELLATRVHVFSYFHMWLHFWTHFGTACIYLN